LPRKTKSGRPPVGRPSSTRPQDAILPYQNGGRRRAIYISLALAAAVFVVYGRVLGFGFIGYDDPEFVVNNLHLRGGLTAASIAWAFRTGYAANWFPLTWLSYMVGWHHFTNVLLHALNTVLLFAVMRRMTGAFWKSAAVAALFAVHPLHVEPVAWIAERREVLSGLFWILSLGAYLRYVNKPSTAAYGLLAAAFACGLMSKPMIVTLPFALLLLDYWPLGRWGTVSARRLVMEKVPLLGMAIASSIVTLDVQQGGGATATLAEVPLHWRVENAVAAYASYVLQFLWPARLAVLYPYAADLPAWRWIGATAVLAAITAAVLWQRNRRPWLFVGWFWFGGILVPAIGLVQVGVQGRADRYMYVPLIGLAVIAVWGVGEVKIGYGEWGAGDREWWRPTGAALVCAAYAFVAWQTVGYWRDTVALFRHAVEVTDGNWAALNVLGRALLAENRVDEAMPYVTEALRLRPNLTEARINAGAAFSKKGDFAAAEAQYRAALAEDPANADAREGLGVVLTEQERYDEALPNLRTAASNKPEDADAHYNLGRLYGLTGQPDLAITEFRETVRLQPDDAAAHFNLGTADVARERIGEACEQFREALRLKPDYAAAQRAVEACAGQ